MHEKAFTISVNATPNTLSKENRNNFIDMCVAEGISENNATSSLTMDQWQGEFL